MPLNTIIHSSMKKHLFYTLLFVLLLGATKAVAQPKHSLAFRPTFYNFITPLGTDGLTFQDIYDRGKGRGLEVAYYNRLFPRTYLAIPFKFGTARTVENDTRERAVMNLDALLQHNLFRHGAWINPYVHAGLGTDYAFNSDGLKVQIPVGLGLNIKLFENVYLSGQTQHRFGPSANRNWQHGIGLHIFFGNATPPAPVLPPPPPDSDSDGVTDNLDKCPQVAGLAALSGCPDADGDGVADMDDECPNEKGKVALKGCADTDGDGVADKNDRCPREAGPASNAGCPVIADRDGDGVPDAQDACPDAKGVAALQGCPDRDGDGVADRNDPCPDRAGSFGGCPDTDGDGVADNTDKCPDKAGTVANKGCPEISQEDKATLEKVIKRVQFETSKAVLLNQSYGVLDEVVRLMSKYPEYALDITGHTDNVGDDQMNMELSKRRAKACYDYLVSKGVAAARMQHSGMGETKPLVSNTTPEGRAQNRRVTFTLKVE